MIDIHSHIMPSIDDGAINIEESIKLLKYAASSGITDIILTPHYVKDTTYTANNDKKIELLEILKKETSKNQIEINLYLGNEVFIDENIDELLKIKEIATLNNSRYLLMEFSMETKPLILDEVIDTLLELGITPIIAHPERYMYYYKNIDIFEDLVNRGCLLQSNIGSLYGKYGKNAQKMVKILLKRNLITFIASDIHHYGSNLYSLDIEKKLLKIVKDKQTVENLLINNQLKVINNENL